MSGTSPTARLLSLILLIVSIVIGPAATRAASASGSYVDVAEVQCVDQASCPANQACQAQVRGCHGRGQCAVCGCAETNCGCTCKKQSELSPRLAWVAFDRADDTFTFLIDNMPFQGKQPHEGFIGFLRMNAPPSWTITTTVVVDPDLRVDYRNTPELRDLKSMREALGDVASLFGIEVEISDSTRTVHFHDGR
jgi:hypothetical protein